MNAEELMIGDWVNLYGSPIKINIDDLGVIERDETYDRGINCKPIPLTKEILEKNNDVLCGELPILFDDGKMHYSIVECKYVSKEYERNNENFYCLLSSCAYNGGSFITPFAKIRYVHELQRALKSCGIEKEITV